MKKPILRNIMFAAVIVAGFSFASCRDNNRVDDNTETIDAMDDKHDSELENDLERAGEDIEHTADTIEDDIDREL